MFMLRNTKELPQIFDLLQLSKEEKEAKTYCSCKIRQFNHWKNIRTLKPDFSLKLQAQIKIILLRRHAQESVHRYRALRSVRAKEFQKYMDQLPLQKIIF